MINQGKISVTDGATAVVAFSLGAFEFQENLKNCFLSRLPQIHYLLMVFKSP